MPLPRATSNPTNPLCRPRAKSGSSGRPTSSPVRSSNLMDTIRRDNEQTVDHDNLDTLLRAEWAGDVAENAKKIAQDFEDYLKGNRDEIEALTIYFAQPARRSRVTYAMIKDVLAKLKEDRPRLAPLTVWRAYAHLDDYKGENPVNELTALVALIPACLRPGRDTDSPFRPGAAELSGVDPETPRRGGREVL